MGFRAAVVGASGYAGGELLRILLDHPTIELGPVTAGSHAGGVVAAVHPQLPRLGDRAFAATEPGAVAGADIVFMALPHGESGPFASALPAGTPIVDIGADHRLADSATWEQFYGTAHAGKWPYGLPELPGARARIAVGERVANPGCYAEAMILALNPAVSAGLVDPGDLVAVATSGTTGAGRAPRPHLMGSEVMGSVAAYKAAGAHQHTPEVEQVLTESAGSPATLSFTPTLAPMPRGILATCTARLWPGVDAGSLRDAYSRAYDAEPFVYFLPEGTWPRTADTYGSNAAHLQMATDTHAGRAVVVCALDNLGKGAAGQATQNANLLLGLDETSGLTAQGVAP